MSSKQETRRHIHELLRQQQLGVLSTVGEGAPYANLIAFAASEDDRHLFFITPMATRKYANITANARVALLVNNSINDPEDFHLAAAVTAVGSAHPVEDSKRNTVRHQYLVKHPYLHEFAHSPSCQLLGIRVERYILVERFQNVTEYRIDHAMECSP